MKEFPEFMKHPDNKIRSSSQYTADIKGYAHTGKNESQMPIWTCYKEKQSKEHAHDYDEYMICVQGQYKVLVNNESHILNTGDELFIPKGTSHSGESIAGTRTIHAFGGTRIKKDAKKAIDPER